ncbi:MAG: hypothetical protein II954_07580, partial [Synergistaceae bacterium]|nr:hypothetical protein [Synergistaceae bacterium]
MNDYSLKDIYSGMQESFSVKITPELEDSFRELTGDRNPLHYDDEFAQKYLRGGGHA